MGNAFAFEWENQLIICLQQFMPEWVVGIAAVITEFGDALVLVGIIGLFYWALDKELGKRLLVYLSLVNCVNPFVKSLVQRLRPYMVDPRIKCLKAVSSEGDIYDVVAQEFAFPSGHAADCTAIYGPLAARSKRAGWVAACVVLTLLVGVSRFALGVHYPTDVLVGWAIGFACVGLFCLLEKAVGRNRALLILNVLGLAGFFVARTNDYFSGYGMLLGGTLGILFEERFVRFEGTKKALPAILRTLVGAGLYLGLNELMKLPFSADFLNSGTLPAFIVRAARYAILVFLLLGVYPLAFGRFGTKKKQ